MFQFRKYINELVYQKDFELIHSPNKKSLDYFNYQVIFGTIFTIFTSGVFLSGYLIYLGASDNLVSYVPLIPTICCVFVVFFASFVERYNRRRKLVLIINGFTKFILISIIVIPLITPKFIQIPVIYFLLVLGYTLNSINVISINSWFIAVIPSKIRGRYVSIRQILAVVLSIVIPVLAGRLVDVIPNKYNGFLLLYIVVIIAAVFENIYYGKVEDPEIRTMDKKLSCTELIKLPLQNKKFINFILLIGVFYMFLYISASFNQLYMIKYLHLSYTDINAAAIITSILQALIFYRLWGKLSDRFGSYFVMITSMWFYILDSFIWFLIIPETVKYLLPLSSAMIAAGGSGFVIGSFNRRFEIIPEVGRSVFDSFYQAFIGLVLFISPTIGTMLRETTAHSKLISNFQFGNFRIVYLISAVTLILLQLFNLYYIRRIDPNNECLKKNNYIESINVLRNIMKV